MGKGVLLMLPLSSKAFLSHSRQSLILILNGSASIVGQWTYPSLHQTSAGTTY
jgi:hypothetical protein